MSCWSGREGGSKTEVESHVQKLDFMLAEFRIAEALESAPNGVFEFV